MLKYGVTHRLSIEDILFVVLLEKNVIGMIDHPLYPVRSCVSISLPLELEMKAIYPGYERLMTSYGVTRLQAFREACRSSRERMRLYYRSSPDEAIKLTVRSLLHLVSAVVFSSWLPIGLSSNLNCDAHRLNKSLGFSAVAEIEEQYVPVGCEFELVASMISTSCVFKVWYSVRH
ncbi:hypothetical protein Tco_0018249 [Tanacetum coccineum]